MQRAGLFELNAALAGGVAQELPPRRGRAGAVAIGAQPRGGGAGTAAGRAAVQPHDAKRRAVGSRRAVLGRVRPALREIAEADGRRPTRRAIRRRGRSSSTPRKDRRGGFFRRCWNSSNANPEHAGPTRHRRPLRRHRRQGLRRRHPAQGVGAAGHDGGAVQPGPALRGGRFAALFQESAAPADARRSQSAGVHQDCGWETARTINGSSRSAAGSSRSTSRAR